MRPFDGDIRHFYRPKGYPVPGQRSLDVVRTTRSYPHDDQGDLVMRNTTPPGQQQGGRHNGNSMDWQPTSSDVTRTEYGTSYVQSRVTRFSPVVERRTDAVTRRKEQERIEEQQKWVAACRTAVRHAAAQPVDSRHAIEFAQYRDEIEHRENVERAGLSPGIRINAMRQRELLPNEIEAIAKIVGKCGII